MGKASYRQIGGPDGLLANLATFEGNTMKAVRHFMGSGRSPVEVPRDAMYYVYSYATPIAWVLWDETVVVPDCRYSVTTSRQQTLCRAWLGSAK